MSKKYIVQVTLIEEVEVTAADDLQAEIEAFKKMGSRDRDRAIAMLVLEEKHGGGALASDDLAVNWRFARENFAAIDPSWVGRD